MLACGYSQMVRVQSPGGSKSKERFNKSPIIGKYLYMAILSGSSLAI
jgi:hypothetical protein